MPAGIYRVHSADPLTPTSPLTANAPGQGETVSHGSRYSDDDAFPREAAVREECYGSDWLHPQIHIARDGRFRAPGKRVRS